MQKPRDDVCGCCGTGKPRELRHLIDMLERQAAEKKEKEEKTALSPSSGATPPRHA